MATRLLLAISISLLVSAAVGRPSRDSLSAAKQCRLDRLRVSKPYQKIESEGGITELFNDEDREFQCTGVAAMKDTLSPKSLTQPNYHPFPQLVYIEKGRGLVSVIYPGCAETYHSLGHQQHEKSKKELHQKVHRIRQGDIVLLPAGATHFAYNDGDEDLVAVSISDLNNRANQLDQRYRAFYLAGGASEKEEGSERRVAFRNIFRAFDSELMAEALNIREETLRKMIKEDSRGKIVKAREELKLINPDEEWESRYRQGQNGLDESFCTLRINENIDDSRKEAQVLAWNAGRLNVANERTLPILRSAGLSAEKLDLLPQAIYTPQYSVGGHSLLYVLRGEARLEVTDGARTNLDETVRRGDLIAIPQFYVWTLKAGDKGFESVTFMTTSLPAKSPLAGYTSVMRALPVEVITNSYEEMSPREAEELKERRSLEALLLSPGRRPSS